MINEFVPTQDNAMSPRVARVFEEDGLEVVFEDGVVVTIRGGVVSFKSAQGQYQYTLVGDPLAVIEADDSQGRLLPYLHCTLKLFPDLALQGYVTRMEQYFS